MRVRVDASQVRRLADDLGSAGRRVRDKTERIVEKTGHDVVRTGQVNAPVDTGNLRASIGVDIDADRLGFEAGPYARYGAAVEFGTVPHEIRPRTARALWWPGAQHPVARVQHPGTAPQPYMIPAFNRHVPRAMSAMAHAAGDIL